MDKYKCKYGVTEEMIKWLLKEGILDEEDIVDYNEVSAGLMKSCYNIHHNKKCIGHSKMIKNENGKMVMDTVYGYVNESYEAAKARELAEQEDFTEPQVKRECDSIKYLNENPEIEDEQI